MLHDVTKVVAVWQAQDLAALDIFRGRRSTLETSDVILRGRRGTLDVSFSVLFANRIVSAIYLSINLSIYLSICQSIYLSNKQTN